MQYFKNLKNKKLILAGVLVFFTIMCLACLGLILLVNHQNYVAAQNKAFEDIEKYISEFDLKTKKQSLTYTPSEKEIVDLVNKNWDKMQSVKTYQIGKYLVQVMEFDSYFDELSLKNKIDFYDDSYYDAIAIYNLENKNLNVYVNQESTPLIQLQDVVITSSKIDDEKFESAIKGFDLILMTSLNDYNQDGKLDIVVPSVLISTEELNNKFQQIGILENVKGEMYVSTENGYEIVVFGDKQWNSAKKAFVSIEPTDEFLSDVYKLWYLDGTEFINFKNIYTDFRSIKKIEQDFGEGFVEIKDLDIDGYSTIPFSTVRIDYSTKEMRSTCPYGCNANRGHVDISNMNIQASVAVHPNESSIFYLKDYNGKRLLHITNINPYKIYESNQDPYSYFQTEDVDFADNSIYKIAFVSENEIVLNIESTGKFYILDTTNNDSKWKEYEFKSESMKEYFELATRKGFMDQNLHDDYIKLKDKNTFQVGPDGKVVYPDKK